VLVVGRHKLCRIWLTFYTYYISFRTKRTFHRWTKREALVRAVKFIRKLLDAERIEIVCLNRKKPYTDEEKLPKKVILAGIRIILRKCLEVTYTEEYEKIYKPISNYLAEECRLYIYNMWGYGEQGSGWQMDGRHIHLDYTKSEKTKNDCSKRTVGLKH